MTTRFAPAERSPREKVEQDFQSISQNVCSIYFDNFPLPLCVLNGHRQIVFSNRACLEMLGIRDAAGFVGSRPGEAMHCVYSGLEPGGCGTSKYCGECGVSRAVLKSMERNAAAAHDCRILQSEGGECRALDCRIHTAPFDIEGSRYYVLTIQDISDLKRREVMERVFFHDILNTAGGAMNLVEILRTGGGCNLEESLELLGMALNGLVEEVLTHRDLLLAEKGDYPLSETTVPSLGMVEAVAREMRQHPLAEGRMIEIVPGSADGAIRADRSLLRRVLVNMIKNGLEATPPGGRVGVGCHCAGADVVFEVHNDQVMERATRLQVFKRSFSTKGRGRGLGTYSIKLLTENYLCGKVEFVSNEQVGTVFRVSFPAVAGL
ncbi:MAG: PAS domain-containing sensor histidine kinase [Pseudodesulfovibrio sp.]